MELKDLNILEGNEEEDDKVVVIVGKEKGMRLKVKKGSHKDRGIL